MMGEASDDSIAKRITFFPGEIRKRLNFRASHHPGDNYRAVANGDEDFVRKLRNRDKDDGFRIVDPHVGGDADARQVRQADKYTSHVLTVWRILHVESDSMEAVPTDETHPERNFVTGVIERVIKGPTGKATHVYLGVDLEHLPNGTDLSTGNGRFEKGKIWIGKGSGTPGKTETGGLGKNGMDSVTKIGIDIPFKISENVRGKVLEFDKWSRSFTLITENGVILSGDHRGQTINIAGVEMIISDVSGNTVKVDPLKDIPYKLVDDDHGSDTLPHYADLSGLKAYEKAYLLWVNDGGGGDNNSDDVPFKLNALNTPDNFLDTIYRRGSKNNEKNVFWVVYVCTAWQKDQRNDNDPDEEDGSASCVENEIVSHNTDLKKGANGCLIFRETILDIIDTDDYSLAEKRTVIHEIGHQFGLGHGDANGHGGQIPEFPNVGLMHPTGGSPNPDDLIPRHINVIRSRTESPGEGE